MEAVKATLHLTYVVNNEGAVKVTEKMVADKSATVPDMFRFGMCEKLAKDNRKIEPFALISREPIEDPIEALLADLKSIMVKHISGEYDENLCYAVIFAISSLEKDIKQHNRIRYRILLPMISAMEKLNS